MGPTSGAFLMWGCAESSPWRGPLIFLGAKEDPGGSSGEVDGCDGAEQKSKVFMGCLPQHEKRRLRAACWAPFWKPG